MRALILRINCLIQRRNASGARAELSGTRASQSRVKKFEIFGRVSLFLCDVNSLERFIICVGNREFCTMYKVYTIFTCTRLWYMGYMRTPCGTWGPLPVETRVTGPPIFVWRGQQCFWPPKFWEVYNKIYNNSNLVNNEVFKKLTTKLASMKYMY